MLIIRKTYFDKKRVVPGTPEEVRAMILRFGYVSTALSLWEASPSRTLTFASWKKLDKRGREEKLYEKTEQNLKNTLRMLHYNIAHGIDMYRMSSSLIPRATCYTSGGGMGLLNTFR